MMRWLLVEAAQTAARYDPELRRAYLRLKLRRVSGVAKVAVAAAWRSGCILLDAARADELRAVGSHVR